MTLKVPPAFTLFFICPRGQPNMTPKEWDIEAKLIDINRDAVSFEIKTYIGAFASLFSAVSVAIYYVLNCSESPIICELNTFAALTVLFPLLYVAFILGFWYGTRQYEELIRKIFENHKPSDILLPYTITSPANRASEFLAILETLLLLWILYLVFSDSYELAVIGLIMAILASALIIVINHKPLTQTPKQ